MRAKYINEVLRHEDKWADQEIERELNNRKLKLEKAVEILRSEGFNVELYYQGTTKEDIDFYGVIDDKDDYQLTYVPKGFMRTISNSDDWGFCVVPNIIDEDGIVSFEEDFNRALSLYRKKLKEINE